MKHRMHVDATVGLLLRIDPITGKTYVLLGHKTPQASYGAGKIAPPGGKRESDETFEHCLVRKFFDETNIKLDESVLEHVANLWTFCDGQPRFFVRVYTVRAYGGEPIASTELVPGWYDIENLPFDEMFDGDRGWMPGILRGEHRDIWVYAHTDPADTWSVTSIPWNT